MVVVYFSRIRVQSTYYCFVVVCCKRVYVLLSVVLFNEICMQITGVMFAQTCCLCVCMFTCIVVAVQFVSVVSVRSVGVSQSVGPVGRIANLLSFVYVAVCPPSSVEVLCYHDHLVLSLH